MAELRRWVRIWWPSALVLGLVLTLPSVASARQQDGDDLPGVTGEREYESPEFGYEVVWDEPWGFPPEPAISGATSEEGFDTLTLTIQTPGGGNRAQLGISGYAHEADGYETAADYMQDLLDYWESDEYAEITSESDEVDILLSEIDDESVTVLMTFPNLFAVQDLRLIQVEASRDGSYAVRASFDLAVDDFEDYFPRVQEEIEVEGDPPFTLLDEDDIVEAVAGIDLRVTGAGGDGDESDEVEGRDEGDGGGDTDGYLVDVRDEYEALEASIDRFFTILDTDSLSEDDQSEIEDILASWQEAESIAEEMNSPSGAEDVQDAYLAYTQALGDAAQAFFDFAEADPDSSEQEAALDAFGAALDDAATFGADLDAALTAAGA